MGCLDMNRKQTKLLDIINKSKVHRENEYIDYFFSEIVSMKDHKPIFEKIDNYPNSYLSIVKDSTDRILEKTKGRLMERSWRNTIFYFVDKGTFIDFFGTNSLHPVFNIENSEVIYKNENKTVNSKYPNEPRIRFEISEEFQKMAFKHFKDTKSSWFVRSYVYFVLVFSDKNSNISDKDYSIFYWNTNYKFRPISGRKAIFHNVSDSYFVEDIKNEIKLIEMTNRDAIDCVKSFTGNLDFRYQTDENYSDIKKDIDNDINYIIVRGAASNCKRCCQNR